MPDCDPNTLLAESACMSCLTPVLHAQVQTYLLALLAGASTDPNTLIEAAKCFKCLSPPQLLEVQVYLLCQLVNA